MCWRLQPYVLEAATPCDRGCNPMYAGGFDLVAKASEGIKNSASLQVGVRG